MRLKTITAAAMLLFVFAFTSIILFGFFGQTTDAQSSATFITGYIALIAFVLFTIYISLSDSLSGFAQHTIIIVGIIAISGLLAATASNIKDANIRNNIIAQTQQNSSNDSFEQDLQIQSINEAIAKDTAIRDSLLQQLSEITSENSNVGLPQDNATTQAQSQAENQSIQYQYDDRYDKTDTIENRREDDD